jgi:tetratricopeptide (TPR) repeat protein
LGRYLLLFLTLLGPWLNGGGDPLPQAILYSLNFVLVVTMLRDMWLTRSGVRFPWLFLPVCVATVLGVLHLLPLWDVRGSSWVPSSVQLRGELTSADDGTLESPGRESPLTVSQRTEPTHWPWTLDVHATEQTLSLMVLGLSAAIAGAYYFKEPQQTFRLVSGLAWCGVGLTCFAVLVKATWNGKLYWFIPVGFGRGVFGPMVYHNQAGGILLMTVISAFVLVIRRNSDHQTVKSRHSFGTVGWLFPEKQVLQSWLILAINVAGLLLTLSRGAVLSLLIASLVTIVWLRPRSGWQGLAFPLCLAIVGGLSLVAWFRASDVVSRRYSSLMQSEQLLEDVRLDHWQDGFRAARDYGWWGVGLGAYRHIHPLFQDNEIERIFLRAHNQYLETLVDSGILGVVLLAAVIGLTLRMVHSLSQRREVAIQQIATWGALILVGQLAHAGVDFCMYLPATTFMFGTIIGSVSGVAWEAALVRHEKTTRLGWQLGCASGITCIFLLAATCLWGSAVGWRWAREEEAVYAAPWNESNRALTLEETTQAIGKLEAVVPYTKDWRVAQALGELYLADFRLRLHEELEKEMVAEGELDLDDEVLWQFSDPMVLHRRAHALASLGELEKIEEEIRSRPLIGGRLAQAHEMFRVSRRLCPMTALVHLRLSELDFLRQKLRFDDVADLQRAQRIGIGNPDLLYEAGRRWSTSGNPQRAVVAWKESLTLSRRHWPEIYRLVGEILTPTEMLEQILPSDPTLLLSIAGRQLTEPEQRDDRARFLDAADRLLGTEVPSALDQRGKWHLRRAELGLLRGDRNEAVTQLSAAVNLSPSDHGVRAQLAQVYALENRYTDALREARYCLALQPNNWEYRALVEKIIKVREPAESAPQNSAAARSDSE